MAEGYTDSQSRLKGLVASFVLFVLLPSTLAYWCFWVPGQSFTGKASPLSGANLAIPAELKSHVIAIAGGPHNVQHFEALQSSAVYVEGELRKSGLNARSQYFWADKRQVRNIEVILPARSPEAPTLVVGAHYDSAGRAPGANDNGSGVAALLVLARQLRAIPQSRKLHVRLVFFVNEEPPYFRTKLMGSYVYANALHEQGVDVAGMLSLETMGYFDQRPGSQRYPFPLSLVYPDTGNFIAFVGMTTSRGLLHKSIQSFRKHAEIPSVGGVAPGIVRGIDWSDHRSFDRFGYPAIMVTDTAPFRYRDYHTEDDTVDKIDFESLARVELGLKAMIEMWMRNGLDVTE
jgi:Zn-dependent M28 family amino/carboxypeptidase